MLAVHISIHLIKIQKIPGYQKGCKFSDRQVVPNSSDPAKEGMYTVFVKPSACFGSKAPNCDAIIWVSDVLDCKTITFYQILTQFKL